MKATGSWKNKWLDALGLRAGLWLLLAMAAIYGCIVQSVPRFPLETNLLAMLPSTERNVVAEQAVNHLAEAAGNRAVFLVGHNDETQAVAAAQAFAQRLRGSSHFRYVLAEIPPLDPKTLGQFFLPYRFNLLSHTDKEQLQAHTADPTPWLAERLQNKLYAPFRFGLSMPIAQDPFGFTDNWLGSLPLKNLRLEPENGMLLSQEAGKTWVFISADLKDSAYDGQLQQQVVQMVDQAVAKTTAAFTGTQVLRTGTLFYANAAHSNAEAELHRISIVSVIGMLILLFLVFRSVRPLALGLLSVGFGISSALAVSLLVFGQIHLITLVFGASLIGEAIDYAIQYFAAHMGAGQQWEPMQGLRRIRAGLTVALITSLMGYAALALAPFPALAQIAVFALVGLSAAWLSVFLLLPAMLRQPSKRQAGRAIMIPQRMLQRWQYKISARNCLLAAGLMLVVALPGWLQLSANDDVHLLISRPASLVKQEEAIRRIIGFDNSSQFFLVEGASVEDVLQHEEALHQRLTIMVEQGHLEKFQGVASFVPSAKRQQENQALMQVLFRNETALRDMLAEAGLRDEAAQDLLAAFHDKAEQPLNPELWLSQGFARPYAFLWLGKTDQGYASIVLPQGIKDMTALKQATQGLAHVVLVDKAGSVSALFQHYRQWTMGWLLMAIVLILLLLRIRYSWQQALIILLPTLLAMILTIGLFGYLHIALTLFNMMSLMLMLGIGINYAIFLREGGINRAATLAGVLLSAGTTLLSFGMLAFSSMPALENFGLTLLCGIAISALLAPMLLSFEQQSGTTTPGNTA